MKQGRRGVEEQNLLPRPYQLITGVNSVGREPGLELGSRRFESFTPDIMGTSYIAGA